MQRNKTSSSLYTGNLSSLSSDKAAQYQKRDYLPGRRKRRRKGRLRKPVCGKCLDEMKENVANVNQEEMQSGQDYLSYKTLQLNQLLIDVLKDRTIRNPDRTNLIEKISELTDIIQTLKSKKLQKFNEQMEDHANNKKFITTEKYQDNVNVSKELHFDHTLSLPKISEFKKRLRRKTSECIQLQKNVKLLKNKVNILSRSSTLDESKIYKRLLSCNKLISYQKNKIIDLENALDKSNLSMMCMKDSLGKLKAANAGRGTVIIRLQELLNKYAVIVKKFKKKEQKLELCCEKLKSEIDEKNRKLDTLKEKLEDFKRKNEEATKNFQNIYEENSALKKNISLTELNQLSQSKVSNRIKELKKFNSENMILATIKLTQANNKIKELFATIEMFVRKMHTSLYSAEVNNTFNHCSEEISRMNFCSLLQLDPEEITHVLTTGKIPQVSDWVEKCDRLVHQEKFADDLCSFMMSLFQISKS
ncbi:uncharacterized protein isoform X3 [Rhodnius prolixus]|uniref:uncharacterized protein isoform X3 n=1 Tax=Rhodnius prolixus TaxID=13249 RepID=UPI003D18A36B